MIYNGHRWGSPREGLGLALQVHHLLSQGDGDGDDGAVDVWDSFGEFGGDQSYVIIYCKSTTY